MTELSEARAGMAEQVAVDATESLAKADRRAMNLLFGVDSLSGGRRGDLSADQRRPQRGRRGAAERAGAFLSGRDQAGAHPPISAQMNGWTERRKWRDRGGRNGRTGWLPGLVRLVNRRQSVLRRTRVCPMHPATTFISDGR